MSPEDRHPQETPPSGFSLTDGPLKPAERGPATLAHLVSLLPLWGVVFLPGRGGDPVRHGLQRRLPVDRPASAPGARSK
ncbi:MAG: hypothetical protein NTW86_01475 [Candidatus Sumerlaeota bacterium]|nr:hypothetical protein [Candidatus Sumerlaeota bacterium]